MMQVTECDTKTDDDELELVEVIDVSDEECKAIFAGLFEADADGRSAYQADTENVSGARLRSRGAGRTIETRKINADARTVDVAVSSETEVQRWFGRELLEHTSDAIDLGFMASGTAPLLLDHDQTRQIGVVESVRLDSDRVLRAKVRFGRSRLAQEVFQDVIDGIRANVSVGYEIARMEKDPLDKDLYRVKRWTPMEVSIVSIPADRSVGVGRSKAPSAPTIITKSNSERGKPMAEVITEETAPHLDAIRAELAEEAKRHAESMVREYARSSSAILELGARYNKRDLANKAIAEGKTLEEFRGMLLDAIGSAPLETGEIGMSKRERQRFSLMRLIRALANPANRVYQQEARLELEASEAAQELRGFPGQGVTIPREVLAGWRSDVRLQRRDLNTADDSAIIAEDFRASEFIDVLRNSTSVMQAGARMLTGLQGNVAIPKKTGASTGAWISTEGGAAAESEPTFGQVTLAPKVVGAFTDITRLMMQQSSLDVEALVRDDLARGIALAIDKGGLEGTGTAGQPTGVRNVTGINTRPNFAGPTPTFAEIVAFETALAEDNSLIGNLAYITDASIYGGLKTQPKDAGSGIMVLQDGEMNGYPVVRSQQCTPGRVYFGNFDDLLIGMWDGLDIVIDPYTSSTSGTVRIVAMQTVDVAVRHPVSFCFGQRP